MKSFGWAQDKSVAKKVAVSFVLTADAIAQTVAESELWSEVKSKIKK